MIAPITIKKTHAVSSSNSQLSAKPLRVCEVRRGADAVGFFVVEGAGDVDDEVGVVAVDVGAGVVGVGAGAVGASGNC
jgi:hypothetical protein